MNHLNLLELKRYIKYLKFKRLNPFSSFFTYLKELIALIVLIVIIIVSISLTMNLYIGICSNFNLWNLMQKLPFIIKWLMLIGLNVFPMVIVITLFGNLIMLIVEGLISWLNPKIRKAFPIFKTK